MIGPLLTGYLLVASPTLVDPNFARTVVLVCAHSAEGGAFGLVLNRPLEAAVSSVLPAWSEHVAYPPVVFGGGPVEPGRAAALARRRPGVESPHWSPITDEVGLLDLEREPGDTVSGLQGVRIFAGYAGWAPGQLEGEVQEEAWYVVPSLPDDPFTAEAANLWERVLERQPGGLALYAFFPREPSPN